VAQVSTSPAQPGDYHQSWGKVEPWNGPTVPQTVEQKVRPADPTQDPDWYHKRAMNDLEVKQTGKKDKPGFARASDRPGMGSVLVAPDAAIEEGGNAFGPPMPSPMPMGPPPVPPDPFCGRQVVPVPPSPPWSPFEGPLPGAANAFTRVGPQRPIPADFSTPQPPMNAFSATAVDTTGFFGCCAPAGTGGPMCAPSYPVPNGCKPCGPTGCFGPMSKATSLPENAGTPELVAMLKTSAYPSQREWAAECLARQDWKTQPQIVGALVCAAREDPAAAVRAGCVRALGRMKANTLPVVQTVQALRSDNDPRVRLEVDEVLAALGAAPKAPDAIRPVSATMPANGRMP
jgi:hypothetical protein